MSSLVEIRNAEEIYIHYFADKCREVTDVKGESWLERKSMVFSLTQIENSLTQIENSLTQIENPLTQSEAGENFKSQIELENSCQGEEHFVNPGQKCDQQRDFCQKKKKTGARLDSFATSLRSTSGSDEKLMGEHIDNSTAPSQGVSAMAAEERETKLDATKSSKKVKVKVGQKEHVRVKKDREKSLVKFEELLLQLESFPVCPKTNKDVGTQVQKGLLRRILGEPLLRHYWQQFKFDSSFFGRQTFFGLPQFAPRNPWVELLLRNAKFKHKARPQPEPYWIISLD